MSAKGYLVAVVALLGLCMIVTFGEDSPAPQPTSVTTSVEPAEPVPVPPSEPGPMPAMEAAPDQVQVTRVIDGDTFELSDGTRIRPLGIDSCEMSTPGGQLAKQFAQNAFANPYNHPVTLTREPGVDRDQHGRLLRYVQLGGSDYGRYIVSHDHTGIYQGRNDASAEYLASLRERDNGGRNCSGSVPPVNDTAYVPAPTGGDDDGESRFCRKRRWC